MLTHGNHPCSLICPLYALYALYAVWFSSYYPTPLRTGRSVPPRHVPVTPPARSRTPPGHAPMRLHQSRALLMSPPWVRLPCFTPRARLTLGGPRHGAHDPSHGHDHARHGCGHVPSTARPAHAPTSLAQPMLPSHQGPW